MWQAHSQIANVYYRVAQKIGTIFVRLKFSKF